MDNTQEYIYSCWYDFINMTFPGLFELFQTEKVRNLFQ
jgi:hypothetical protein